VYVFKKGGIRGSCLFAVQKQESLDVCTLQLGFLGVVVLVGGSVVWGLVCVFGEGREGAVCLGWLWLCGFVVGGGEGGWGGVCVFVSLWCVWA